MIKLGITGGISSGKSTAAQYLSKKDSTYVFNADRKSKKHLRTSSSLQKKLINVFGNNIAINKKIDLNLLAEKAFSSTTNHKILNGIMWPEISTLISNSYNEALENKYKLFIVDAALIFEANFMYFFDKIALISTNKSKRIERTIKRDNLSLENIQNRIYLQMSESKKKKLADIIIYNNGNISNLYKKLDTLYLETISKE